MDWPNERYVRLFTRNTTNWRRFGWDGQAVLMQLLRVVDRSGVLDIGDLPPWEATMLHTGAPQAAATNGIAKLIELGTVVHESGRLVIPSFLEAQEAAMSDRQRARVSRETRSHAVTRRHTEPTSPTSICDEPREISPDVSHAVTPRHAASRAVTARHSEPSEPSRSELIRAEPSDPAEPAEPLALHFRGRDRAPVGEPPPDQVETPTYEPSSVVWRIYENIAGAQGHPSIHRAALASIAAACAARAKEDEGPEFEAVVEALVRSWLSDEWVRKNRPKILNLAENVGKYFDLPPPDPPAGQRTSVPVPDPQWHNSKPEDPAEGLGVMLENIKRRARAGAGKEAE